MAFDPIEHLAEARVESDRRSEHCRGRIVAMERSVDELRYRIEETERELAESRTALTAGGGAVRVVVDGTGTVRTVEFAERWYGTATADEIGSVVLAALREAAGAPTAPEAPAATGIGPLDDLARRLHALRLRLDAAEVQAATAAGDVTVACDGHGTATQVTIRFTGALVAVDLAGGTERWRRTLPQANNLAPNELNLRHAGLADAFVLPVADVADIEDAPATRVIVFDARTGNPRWSTAGVGFLLSAGGAGVVTAFYEGLTDAGPVEIRYTPL